MSNLSDDDYWDSSSHKAFNFDENESHNHGSIKTKSETYSISKENVVVIKPVQNQPECFIHNIITDKNLKKYLDDDKNLTTKKVETNVEETIKNIILGKHCLLNEYRDLRGKLKLLDEAIKSADGNCILMVTLYLFRTLKQSLFHDILKSRPVAFNHYVTYLTTRSNTTGITELAAIKNHNSLIALKLYKILFKYYSNNESPDVVKKKLHTLYNHWFEQLSSNDNDASVIKYFLNLLDLQLKLMKETNQSNSVNDILKVCCQKYWNTSNEHPFNPQTLANKQGVTTKQLEWIFLLSKTSTQSWDDITKQFIKSNWFGNKKIVISLVNIENIIIHLGQNNAPRDLLENILMTVDDKSKSMVLAKKFKCHRYVINTYVQEKDRAALQNYKKKINPQSEDYFFAESALRSTVTKWKN